MEDGRVANELVHNRGVFGNGSRTFVGVGSHAASLVEAVGFAPPSVGDFAGKKWEHRYPIVLEEYYRMAAKYVATGDSSVCKKLCFDGVRFASCNRSSFDVTGCGNVKKQVADSGVRNCTRQDDGCVSRMLLVPCTQCSCLESSDVSDGFVGGRVDGEPDGSVVSDAFAAGQVDDGSNVGRAVEANVDGLAAQSAGGSLPVSDKTLANREKRAKKKERKLRKQSGGYTTGVPDWRKTARSNGFGYRGAFELCDDETRRRLVETRARRLIAENEASVRKAQADDDRWGETVKIKRKADSLKLLKINQQIELTRSQDVEKLKRRHDAKILRDTEVSKVEVERAFGTLAITGNVPITNFKPVGSMSTVYEETVPSLVGGKVCTVKSGSISPNSSASEAEVRKLQKDFVDLQSEHVKVRKSKDVLAKKLENLRFAVKNNSTDAIKVLLAEDCPEMYEESYGFSVDGDGNPCCSVEDVYESYIDDNGRFHFGQDPKVMWDLA